MDQAAQKEMFETVLAAFRRGDVNSAQRALSGCSAEEKKQVWLAIAATLGAAKDYLGQINARERAFDGEVLTREERLRFADMHIAVGQYDRAQPYVDLLLAQDRSDPDFAMVGADLLRWRGELEQAKDLLACAYKAHPQNPDIMQALLDISKGEDQSLITAAKKYVETTSGDLMGRRRLAFTLARRADKSGQYDDAWYYGTLGNSLYQDNAVSDVPTYETRLQRALSLHQAVQPEKADAGANMIYVIGPPRSGGSLLQSILAAHPGLVQVGERGALMGWLLPILDQCPEIEQAVYNWNSIATDLPAADIKGMQSASVEGKDATVFVDKMPHHAHVAGLLHHLHPTAQFIDVRRDPFDVARSIFLRDFSDRFGHTRSFSMISDYLCFQRAAITAWENAGVPIIRHNHSKFLSAPKDIGKLLFDKLGMTWDDNYLAPENRQSMVPTFSSVQVRDTISKAYSGGGQHYRQFMGTEVTERLETLIV